MRKSNTMKKTVEEIIFKPLITEKCTDLRDKQNIYCFEVHPQATKHQIAHKIEKLYDVKVERVNLINIKGKRKRRGMILGQRKDRKKAYIKIKQGDKIQIFEGV